MNTAAPGDLDKAHVTTTFFRRTGPFRGYGSRAPHSGCQGFPMANCRLAW